jgi:hypothetical protein
MDELNIYAQGLHQEHQVVNVKHIVEGVCLFINEKLKLEHLSILHILNLKVLSILFILVLKLDLNGSINIVQLSRPYHYRERRLWLRLVIDLHIPNTEIEFLAILVVIYLGNDIRNKG